MQAEGNIAVYMMASGKHGTLYTGVTADLFSRVVAHREGKGSVFTRRYGCDRLVWFEVHAFMTEAIQRETSIKRWPREWKANLIERDNPHWDDLYAATFGYPAGS